MDRTILHCDCNSFYASVECVFRPELKAVPMAVCGNPENRHGIILAKNELAKKTGVATAETVWQALQKCPELVLVPPRHGEYVRFSGLVNAIYQRYTDQVEPFSIDESWLDVTGSRALFGSGEDIANKIRETVQKELGITVSVGVSFNKIFAKMGSDYKKPNATTVITRENYRQLLWPLPVSELILVGKASRTALRELGIYTIGDLACTDPRLLTARLGKLGGTLSAYARGEESSPVASMADEPEEPKSVGNGMTFRRDLATEDDIRIGVLYLADSVAARLRRHGLRCRTVAVTLKNPRFKSVSRQKILTRSTDLAKTIAEASLELIHSCWNPTSPIRSITITASRFHESGGEQLSLLQTAETQADPEKRERLEQALDRVRDRYGKQAVSFGRILKNDIGIGKTDSTNPKGASAE
ncbi:MAG: DNA polymerase IV [Candidatus Merdivicinus sp.]|jgi:DNA polymerase-4